MKRSTTVLAGIFLLLFIMSGCHKSKGESWMSDTAVITGYDSRYCACCGGWMINFDNNPKPYEGQFALIRNLPANSGISNTSTYPIYVKVNWENINHCGLDSVINVTKLEIR